MKRLVPLICLLVAACAPAKQEREASPVGQASAATRWVVAEPASASAWLEAPARAVAGPHDTALISVPLSARVVRVRVRPGQQVAADEALADVVMPELIRAAGALRSADLRLIGLQKRRERVAGLLAKELALAAELSEVDGNIASVRGERESARATLRAAGESDGRAAALLEGSGAVSLRAPFAGVVVQVNTRLGEVREPSGGPIVELASSDEEHLIEARFAAAPPDGVRFEWVETGRTLPLVLDRVSPHASQDDGSRNAWLHVPAGQPQPVAGAFGRVRMVAPDAWVVLPARALIMRDGALLVATKTSDGSRLTPVTLVQHSASDALVTGIAPGTLVAADATLAGEAQK
jgi:cobalt-zinc-cadmium efflux system membrane fusion protein